jgi:predicted RNase H-like HicB family nuclease
MAKHKRIEKTVQVETCLGLEYSTLAELKGMVEEWIAMHGEDAWLERYQEPYGDDSYYWEINKKVPETDEEYAARVADLKQKEIHQKTIQEARERAEFERLSKKYGAV